MKALKVISVTIPLSIALISCGGGGGGGETTQTTNQATTEDVLSSSGVEIGDVLYNSLASSVSNPNLGVPIVLPSMPQGFGPVSATISAQQVTNCTGSASGDLTDIDDDGIPVNGTYTFECKYGTYVTWKGKISAKDDNDNDRLSGYDICTGVFSNGCSREPTTMTSSLGTVEKITDVNIDKVDSTYVFTPFYHKWTFKPSDPTASTIYGILESTDLSYTPDADGDNDPWDSGTWNGTITATGSDGTSTASINITATDLHISDTCDGADGGSITYSGTCDTGGTFRLTVTLTGCKTGTLEITDCNGNTLPTINF
ncbi:MAG TPA: hypothetical protein DEP48_05270 [Persephonella sp.]|uniref:Putative lipoprotein n=1 Tax=Persephonella marina (strain DSM 14350 / EX-H1) TaxID=123214 RepID=C0QPN9_PERMH|nr:MULTISPECIES: hypothetical protein [Persephonella]ACO04789.1 putative lipoprotein [Persephonella marina EX-H1]HCB69750.1 hypothetical protein [Persephonella sp.]